MATTDNLTNKTPVIFISSLVILVSGVLISGLNVKSLPL